MTATGNLRSGASFHPRACALFLIVSLSIAGSAATASAQPTNLPDPIRAEDFPLGVSADPNQVELGRLLFFDKILSGNGNISCGTCHHGLLGVGDGLSLGIGEGGQGLGVARSTGEGDDAVHERVPRNAPSYFHLGHKDFDRAFHDGRVEVDASQPSGFASPAGNDLPNGLVSVMAAQAHFPVTSATEMAGQAGENPQADFAADGNLPAIWAFIASKIQAVPEYVDMFISVYSNDPVRPVLAAEDISYAHVANAIAVWEAADPALLSMNTPFDRYLRGEKGAMSRYAKRGMELFYGTAGCASCHSGTLLSDMEFHGAGFPQIGPGKGHGWNGMEDFGREGVTGEELDRYKFRTAPLRNVALTAPYGHSGAYRTLEEVLDLKLDCGPELRNYDPASAVLPMRADLDADDFLVMNEAAAVDALAEACEVPTGRLGNRKRRNLLEFLIAGLTDPDSVRGLPYIVPASVPSGLPVRD